MAGVSCDYPPMRNFQLLGLRDEIASALASFGFEVPTDIQSLMAPAVLAGRDAYVSSATGTGKTFGYLAPILTVADPGVDAVQVIVAAPTHDLAAQLFREAERLIKASGLPFRAAQAIGSVPLQRQLDRLSVRPHLVIGSAGRVRDLIAGGHVDASACRWAVLDEADRLFEKEAIDLASFILSAMPATCARMLVSATIPERVIERSAPWFRSPERLVLDPTEALRTSIEHWSFHAASRSKIEFLRRFESAVKPERCLLFASSNASIFTITRKLEYLGFPAVVLKSDREGSDRKTALEAFASGRARWLITTDLGARGLDVPDVSHVISFDLPEEPSVYVHRAGRTGRAGKRGVSIALADLVELKRASRIAVRYGFHFMCKVLDSGVVHDIEPENFFALAEEDEASRKNVKLEAARRPEPGRRRVPRTGDGAGMTSGYPPMGRPRGDQDRRPRPMTRSAPDHGGMPRDDRSVGRRDSPGTRSPKPAEGQPEARRPERDVRRPAVAPRDTPPGEAAKPTARKRRRRRKGPSSPAPGKPDAQPGQE